jgi:hypothetical protein
MEASVRNWLLSPGFLLAFSTVLAIVALTLAAKIGGAW